MTELTYVENITKNKCVVCNDKLTDWEDTYCVLCEPDEYSFDDE